MDAYNTSSQNFSRPHRSKRFRPCDLCRTRKSACRIEGQPPCVICKNLRVECTFNVPPAKRQRTTQPDDEGQGPTAVELSPEQHFGIGQPELDLSFDQLNHDLFGSLGDAWHPEDHFINAAADGIDAVINYDPTTSLPLGPNLLPPNRQEGIIGRSDHLRHRADAVEEVPVVSPNRADRAEVHSSTTETNPYPDDYSSILPQPIKSLDHIDGFSAHYFGLSGESDPYLLRHFRFEDEGQCQYLRVHFRREAAERLGEESDSPRSVPIHFAISADELGNAAKPDTTFSEDLTGEKARSELVEMVGAEDGQRLICLFLKYIFPSLPVLSRTRLGLAASDSQLPVGAQDGIPIYLLAAIYAISIPFCHYDQKLSVSNVYTKPPTDRLWRLCLAGILREAHTAHLCVVQAAILYLQMPRAQSRAAAADTPFTWAFLGLHVDCQHWPIPAWEKRLRRRLWWVVYSDATWRAFLAGFPSPIGPDQWDVSELLPEDFAIEALPPASTNTNANHRVYTSPGTTASSATSEMPEFCHFSQLSSIADDVYRAFYTLKATRKLSRNFDLSLSTARPLRTRLQSWYAALPEHLHIKVQPEPLSTEPLSPDSSAALKLAYLTLELFIYRAILRPLGKTPSSRTTTTTTAATVAAAAATAAGAASSRDTTSPENNNSSSSSSSEHDIDPAAEATISAAEKCAKLLTSFTANLNSRNFGGFWYPWSRICFSTTSNFAMLLLVQAPSVQHAQEAKRIVDTWRQTLRFQSRSFEQMNLGMLRLDVMYLKGLNKVFWVPRPMQEVLGAGEG